MMAGQLTIRRNKSPTESFPCPPSRTAPSATSSSSVNISANIAISVILLKIILISSGVIGATKEEEEESEDEDTVREEEFDELAGEHGRFESGVKPEPSRKSSEIGNVR